MSAEVLVFNILAIVSVIAAFGVVLARNPVHSAAALVVTFINLAGIFVILRAEFLAAVQLIVYTGAILVLVLFVIMLVQVDDLPEFHGGKPVQQLFGFLIGLALLGEVAAAILTRTVVGQPGPWTPEAVEAVGGNVQVLGQFMYSGYVLPIQITAVVLLVGTIAALVLARPEAATDAPKRTALISLAHPRGTDREVAMLGSGLDGAKAAEQRGVVVRDGIVLVDNPEAYTEVSAWGSSDRSQA
jgi:NADH-quinone oxidoreductase subunit J